MLGETRDPCILARVRRLFSYPLSDFVAGVTGMLPDPVIYAESSGEMSQPESYWTKAPWGLSSDRRIRLVSEMTRGGPFSNSDELGARLIKIWNEEFAAGKLIDLWIWHAVIQHRGTNDVAPYLLGVCRFEQMSCGNVLSSIIHVFVAQLLYTFLCATLVPAIADHPVFESHVLPALLGNLSHPVSQNMPIACLRGLVPLLCDRLSRIAPEYVLGLRLWPTGGRGAEVISYVIARVIWIMYCGEREAEAPTLGVVVISAIDELGRLLSIIDFEANERASALIVLLGLLWRPDICTGEALDELRARLRGLCVNDRCRAGLAEQLRVFKVSIENSLSPTPAAGSETRRRNRGRMSVWTSF